MSAPKVGDWVRITFEGELTDLEADTDYPVATLDGSRNFGLRGAGTTFEVAERPKRPLKVGDTIEGDQYENAPVGTVVEGLPTVFYFRTTTGWTDATGRTYVAGELAGSYAIARTVVYLPEPTP